MKRPFVIFVLIVFGLLVASLFTGEAKADEQDCKAIVSLSESELESCRSLIDSRMQERSIRFSDVADETATYRELVDAGETEMKALNAENNADRVRLRMIDRQIQSFQ